MSEYLIYAVNVMILVIQAYLALRSNVKAAAFYIAVGSLNYFAISVFGVWTLDRLCGLVLIAGVLLRKRNLADEQRRRSGWRKLGVVTTYSIIVTIIGMTLWPVQSMTTTVLYSQLRGVIQIINWLIMVSVAIEISVALSKAEAFEVILRYSMVTALLMSTYALYQTVAIPRGWPTTGMRRPAEQLTYEGEGEQFAAAVRKSGEVVIRPSALMGEPKTLGGCCVMWLAFLGALRIRTGRWRREWLVGGLVFAALLSTVSTSALVVSMAGVLLFVLAEARLSMRRAQALAGVVFVVLVTVASGMGVSEGFRERVFDRLELLTERTVDRIREDGAVSDMPELMAMEVFRDAPLLAVTGTGLGGMSFYIAEKLGGAQTLIYFPNNGILAFVSNAGAIGLSLLLWRLRLPLASVFGVSRHLLRDKRALLHAFAGTVCLIQCLVHSGYYLWSISLSLLLTADWMMRTRQWSVSAYRQPQPLPIPGPTVEGDERWRQRGPFPI